MKAEYCTGADDEIAKSLAEQVAGFQTYSNMAVERCAVAGDWIYITSL
jgi:hypothetical protein